MICRVLTRSLCWRPRASHGHGGSSRGRASRPVCRDPLGAGAAGGAPTWAQHTPAPCSRTDGPSPPLEAWCSGLLPPGPTCPGEAAPRRRLLSQRSAQQGVSHAGLGPRHGSNPIRRLLPNGDLPTGRPRSVMTQKCENMKGALWESHCTFPTRVYTGIHPRACLQREKWTSKRYALWPCLYRKTPENTQCQREVNYFIEKCLIRKPAFLLPREVTKAEADLPLCLDRNHLNTLRSQDHTEDRAVGRSRCSLSRCWGDRGVEGTKVCGFHAMVPAQLPRGL